jgi:hypothetical protein
MNTVTQSDYPDGILLTGEALTMAPASFHHVGFKSSVVKPVGYTILRAESSLILSYWLNRNVHERSRQLSFELCASLKNRQCNNEQTAKTPRQPTPSKIKRVFFQRISRHKNTTFNFAQHHPPPRQVDSDNLKTI